MKRIKWNNILKYVVLFLLNVLIILVYYYKIPKDYGMKYMFSFVPLYAVFYGIFSRLLTKSTLYPTIILFVAFWYSFGGYGIIEEGFFNLLFNGYAIDLVIVCALPGMYCAISVIPSLLTGFVIWLIKRMCKKLRMKQSDTGDGQRD